MPSTTVAARIPVKDADTIRAIADTEGTTVSRVVRSLVADAIRLRPVA